MAINTLSFDDKRFIVKNGLSSDTKPTLTVQDSGAIWHVTDTGDKWEWSGSVWYQTHSDGRLMVTDPAMDIATNRIPGKKAVNKFGANADIADGTEEIVWSPSGTYTFSTTADITDIVSSSASDSGKVEVQGLDANWDLVTQTKTLNGTTSVALDTALIRAFRMKYQDPVTNVGDIQCGVGSTTTSFAAANLRAQIDIATGQTLMALYTVPAGKTAYFQKYYGSIIGDIGPPAKEPSYGIWRLWAVDRANDFAPQLKHILAGSLAGTSTQEHPFDPPPSVGEKTDIYITAQPEGDIGSFTAGFDIILVDN